MAKGVLPYRGLGTGARRALDAWPGVEFINDPGAALLTAIVRRTDESAASSVETPPGSVETPPGSVETSPGSVETPPGSVETPPGSVETEAPGTPERILTHFSGAPTASVPAVAAALGLSTRAIEKQIAALERAGRLRHVGPKKGGRWEVLG